MIALEFQSLEDLNRKAPDQASGDSLEIILLNEFVQIHTEQFKRQEQMFAENGVVKDPHNVVFVILVFVFEESEQAKFYACLVLESLLVANYFDSNHHLLLVVKALQSLAKATRAKLVQHFKSVGQMVFELNLVISSFVIKAKVMTKKR